MTPFVHYNFNTDTSISVLLKFTTPPPLPNKTHIQAVQTWIAYSHVYAVR